MIILGRHFPHFPHFPQTPMVRYGQKGAPFRIAVMMHRTPKGGRTQPRNPEAWPACTLAQVRQMKTPQSLRRLVYSIYYTVPW